MTGNGTSQNDRNRYSTFVDRYWYFACPYTCYSIYDVLRFELWKVLDLHNMILQERILYFIIVGHISILDIRAADAIIACLLYPIATVSDLYNSCYTL